MRFYGYIKKDKRKQSSVESTLPLPPPPPSGELADEEDDEDDDGSGKLATPESHDEDSVIVVGKTVSTKGRSILRPRRNEVFLEPESLRITEEASPSDLRVKRRLDSDVVANGSRLKRQVLASPSPPPIPPLLVRERGRKSKPQPLGHSEQSYWRCTLDQPRCSHVVPNAKTRDGRHAIERHYESHGQVMEDARQIIEMEAQAAGGYQVDHLMEKIMMMSRKWEESKPSPLKGLGE
jgi:hypothetical protein